MEFFDDIIIPYEYLQQSSKLYPLIVDFISKWRTREKKKLY